MRNLIPEDLELVAAVLPRSKQVVLILFEAVCCGKVDVALLIFALQGEPKVIQEGALFKNAVFLELGRTPPAIDVAIAALNIQSGQLKIKWQSGIEPLDPRRDILL